MLNGIIDWSLRNRFLVLAAALVFVGVGAFSVLSLPIDAFPDTTPVQVQINTVATGLGPEEVERQITFPVELALGGLPRLEQVRSLSKFGLSQVTVVFADGTDIYFARQVVNERLGTVELSEGLPRPRLGPVATGLGEVFHYTVRSTKPGPSTPAELRRLREIQDWVLRPALRTVAGTAEINSWGGLETQYQVRIDPDKLLKYNLSFDQVMQAVRSNNLNVGGGHLERAGSMYVVHGIGRTYTVPQIGEIVVSTPRGGVPVYVRDVAEVAVGHDLPMGGVTAQGNGEVVLGLGFMLMGENPHEVTQRLKTKLDETRRNLPPDLEVRTVYDRTELVDQVIGTVRRNLFEGGLLVVAVLFIFLGNLRAGLIVALAIPVSMLFAFTGMLRFGIAGSLLSLGAIDFGLVVDSSVVMVENVVRHLSHDRDEGRSRLDVVRDAALEVRGPTMFGELIIMIVYLPILTLEGVAGKLFRPMALTVIFALVASMVLSLTLMPVLASLVLPRKLKEQDPWVVRLARWAYDPVLRLSLRHGTVVLALAAGILGAGGVVAYNLGSEFIPKLSEGALVATVWRLPGTDVREANRLNTRMEKIILEKFPNEVANIWSRCGTAEVATDPMGPEETDFFIALRPRSEWRDEYPTQDALTKAMEKELDDLPGQRMAFSQPIEQRLNEMISGVRATLAVKVFGDDFDQLRETAEEVERVLKGIAGASDVTTEQISGLPVLQVLLDQDQLARYGVSARAVFDRVEALGGKVVGDVIKGAHRHPLAVRLPRGLRNRPEEFAALLVTTPSGEQVPLSRLARVQLIEGPAKVKREWGQRLITVQCNVKDRDVGGFVEEAQERVAEKVKLPSERYRIEWGGDFETMQSARRRLMIVVPVALMLIIVLLYVTYNRLADVVLVFTAVFFAGVGGVVALWLRGLPFSISAGVGFVALFGVSVLNNMVLVTFIRQLRERGLALDRAIEEAALARLRPVLMTALVASLGFLPMALSTGVGAEVQRPLATVVIGGVISSTLLTLLVLPTLYHYFGPRAHGPAAPPAPSTPSDRIILIRSTP
jgi:cobalt-zinc-cadmium resistance protein CzcA